ncbi:hypothetical protein J4429_03830 [Candidatus Pacearchaeota archaeon]|nr:hypothetical protein [Candidatus Pacearchaeota archaeon]
MKANSKKHLIKFGKEPEISITFEKNLAHRLFKFMHHFHYPKITLLIILIISAYYIFKNPSINAFVTGLNSWSYIGIFIAGMLFSFGFTTPFAIGFFIVLNPENIFLFGALAGFGALISDFFMFKFIRFSFTDEFERLEHTKLIKKISNSIEKNLGHKISVYLLYIFVGIIIASPLPDEVGVMMIAGVTKIKPIIFALISLICNTIGITLLLLI